MAGVATGSWSRIRPLAGAVIALVVSATWAGAQPSIGTGEQPAAGAGSGAPRPFRPKLPDLPDSVISDENQVVERPLVGVIDLHHDQDSRTLAGAIAAAIARRPELTTIADAEVAAALVGPLTDEDTRAVEEARKLLDEARDQLAEFHLDLAVDRARSGRQKLLQTTPTSASTALLADLTFVEGQAQFTNNQPGFARTAFALVHRLAPDRVLSRAEHPPKLIEAFTAAATIPPGSATIDVVATGTIWLDGQLQGDGARVLTVPPGAHVVIASGPTLLPSGEYREVVAGQTTRVELIRRPAPANVLATRARKALIDAPDPTARAAAMQQIADIIKTLPGAPVMTDAVLITSVARDEAAIQLWRNRAPGFFKIRSVKRPLLDTEADRVIEPLMPPKKVVVPDPGGFVIPPIETPKPWWKKRWVQVSIVGGAIALIAGSVALSNAIGASERNGAIFEGPK